VIYRTTTGDRRTASLDGLMTMLESQGIAHRYGSGTVVSADTVRGVAAVDLAIRIAATQVAELALGVYRGETLLPQSVTTTWQARIFAGQPNAYQPWSALLEETEAALTGRRNAFWRLDLDVATRRVVGCHFVHQDVMQARWDEQADRPLYRYRKAAGGWTGWGYLQVVHFRVGYADPGCIIAPSPIEEHSDELGGMLSARRHSRNLWERGAPQQIAVTYPKEVDQEKARRTRGRLNQAGVGTGAGAAGQVRFFGAGAQIHTIGLSMRDAQFVEGVSLDVHTAGQIFGVPASLMMAQTGDKVTVPEHEQARWDRYFLGPRRTRIADTLRAHPAWFGPGSRDWPELRAPKIRADVRTEAAAIVSDVQAGILTPDEARALKGYGPHTAIDGSVPQFTPVGGAPNPGTSAPSISSPDAVLAGELDPGALVVPV